MNDKAQNVYEGAPDGRLDVNIAEPSRFRPKYRALSDEEKALHDEIKESAAKLESLFKEVKIKDGKDGRYYKAAMMSLEESVMWIVKELTA